MADKEKEKKKPKQPKPVKLGFGSNFGMRKEKDYFLENLSMLVGSGMDLLYAFNSLQEEVKSKTMGKLIQMMKEQISAGIPLWRAMKDANILPPNLLFLIRIGEETGRLPQNLEVIVKQRDKDRAFTSKVRSAMMYPIIVISLTLIIGIGIAWFILPKLSDVFRSMDLKLPLITRILIAIGLFLNEHGLVAIPLFFLVLGVLIYLFFINSRTKVVGQIFLFHLPVIKKLIRQIELARFGFVLGSLLEAGLPINQAMGSLRQSSNFRVYQKFYTFLKGSVESGNSLQKSFDLYKKAEKLLPPHFQHMITAGEESGTLPQTLVRMGEKYEAKVDETTRNLSVLLEPFLLVIVWIGVLMVALAVIMPIYSLVGQVGG